MNRRDYDAHAALVASIRADREARAVRAAAQRQHERRFVARVVVLQVAAGGLILGACAALAACGFQ